MSDPLRTSNRLVVNLSRQALLTALLASFVSAAAIPAEPVAQPKSMSLDAIIVRAKEDLAKRQSAPLDAINTLSTAEVTWRDTSMGCGKPTELHAKLDIEGYRIILGYQGQRFDYRAREDGSLRLCTASSLRAPR
jgi:hypothetical protein